MDRRHMGMLAPIDVFTVVLPKTPFIVRHEFKHVSLLRFASSACESKARVIPIYEFSTADVPVWGP